jgi:iron complex outermembrane receptor protein
MRRISGGVRFSSTSFVLLVAFWSARADAQMLVHFDLPAQPLAQSLKAIGTATNTDVGFSASQVAGLLAPRLKANLTVDGALTRVLVGTGLRPKHLDDHTIVIAATEASTADSLEEKLLQLTVSPSAGTDPLQVMKVVDSSTQLKLAQTDTSTPENGEKVNSKDTGKPSDQLQEITVTGSHIRGEAPIGSQLRVYSRDDLSQSGAATVDQFARLMPQNFSNNDSVANLSSNGNFAAFSGTGKNISDSAAFNLHGLGPSATLTLINGQRVAPAGSDGSFTDISQIPLSAIDHIEVLSDGASAIYGADAVAGVVNIVTRKDFDGAESGVRYGGATAGGATEVLASQLVGRSWNTGNGLLSYEYDDQGGLDASQRSYILGQGGPFSLVPESRRNSVLASGRQAAGDNTTISVEAIYSHRTTSYASTNANSNFALTDSYFGDEKQSGATLSIEHALNRDWLVSANGSYSRLSQGWNQLGVSNTPSRNTTQTIDAQSTLRSFDVLATGSLLPMPGGPIKAAFGGSFRTEKFAESDVVNSANTPIPAAQRHVSSGYGEIVAPIAGAGFDLPGIKRLNLSAAVRYDSYSDAGSTTNSKLGIAWEPVAGLTFKSTFGTSFQAPLLSQLHEFVGSYAAAFPDPTSQTGTTDTLFKLGGNPDLKPEKSRSLTVGFAFKPTGQPNLEVSANYFHIVFDDRIQTPPVVAGNLFTNVLAPFVIRNPPLAAVQAAFASPGFLFDLARKGPAGVAAIFSDQIANIATTKESGVDLAAAYRLSTSHGQFGLSLDVTHLFRNDFEVTARGPSDALLNDFGQPLKWKGRGGVTWIEGRFTASAFVNYVNGYENNLFVPAQTIDAWATGDLYFGYKTPADTGSGYLRSLIVALTITNVTDKKPPFVGIPPRDLLPGQNPLPFDPANASPVGRLIAIQVTKGWGGR